MGNRKGYWLGKKLPKEMKRKISLSMKGKQPSKKALEAAMDAVKL